MVSLSNTEFDPRQANGDRRTRNGTSSPTVHAEAHDVAVTVNGRASTGIGRLDDLMGGGVSPHSTTLVYADPFSGGRMLSRSFILEGLRQGAGAVVLLTDTTAVDEHIALAALDPEFASGGLDGRIRYVDAYSRTIGADTDWDHTTYVDGVMDLNGLTRAINDAWMGTIGEHEQHHFVVDSLSTVLAYTGVQAAYRFTQLLRGRARRARATSLFNMTRGMHSDPDVQSIMHIADGVVEMVATENKWVLNCIGAPPANQTGKMEYRLTPNGIDLLGSVAAGRIR